MNSGVATELDLGSTGAVEKRPLRVLLVFGHRKKLGMMRMLAALDKPLQEIGVTLFFAVEARNDFSDFPELAERVFEVKGLTDSRTLRGRLFSLFTILRLLRLSRLCRADVIFAYHLAAFPYTLAASTLGRLPHVVALQNVYEQKSRYKKLLLHRARNVFAVSEFMLRFAGEYVGNNGKVHAFVVHNGIDVGAFLSSGKDHEIPAYSRPHGGNTVVGMVSAMEPNKDPQFLLQVARKVLEVQPTVTFLFVGGFPNREYEEETKKLARRLGIEKNVIFAGQQDKISAFFAAFDILAHPRPVVPEAFGLVLIEAMAHGKPVVASRIGGIPEVVLHEETGLLCTPGNQEEFAEALLKLICAPALRRELGRNGATRAREVFGIERTAEKMAEVLRAVAADR
jgi:glycosyltransferase involved in cell wall biosynthesis